MYSTVAVCTLFVRLHFLDELEQLSALCLQCLVCKIRYENVLIGKDYTNARVVLFVCV